MISCNFKSNLQQHGHHQDSRKENLKAGQESLFFNTKIQKKNNNNNRIPESNVSRVLENI